MSILPQHARERAESDANWAKDSRLLSLNYYCRVGRQGDVGCFHDAHGLRPSRNASVIVRTPRGVEQAVVLSVQTTNTTADKDSYRSVLQHDGTILRLSRSDDQLLRKKLDEAAMVAFFACQDYLKEQAVPGCLLDVEAMLDAKTLYFYFLGTPPVELNAELEKLATIFQEKVASSSFAQLLETGCGPGCGSEEKGSCGTGGHCAVCIIAQACNR